MMYLFIIIKCVFIRILYQVRHDNDAFKTNLKIFVYNLYYTVPIYIYFSYHF